MAKNNDIFYIHDESNTKFNFRVAGIITDGDNYLIQHTDGDDYYSLIGGRVELGEDTATSLIREIKEEVGISVNEKDVKLINVVENFFNLKNYNFHELLFIYRVDVSNYKLSKESINTFDKANSINKWFNYNEMLQLNIQPPLIKSILTSEKLYHTVFKDL